MTKKIINVGQTANDRKGDSLRAAFSKVNDNFTELYLTAGKLETFANSAARDVAYPTPVAGQMILVGTATQVYDGTAWRTLTYAA